MVPDPLAHTRASACSTDLEEEFGIPLRHALRRVDRARGFPDAEARSIAMHEFGDMGEARRYIDAVDQAIDHAERQKDIMDKITRSLHHAVRRLWRAPLFTVTSVLTLTIGIGACALMMSLVSTVLLKPLPYARPERIEMIWGYYPGADLGFPEQPTHGRVFTVIRDNIQAFETVAAFRAASYNLGDATDPERLDGIQATGEFFPTLGVVPELGYFFKRENETPGNDRVAVLSDGLWRRRFGADAHVLGRAITLNPEPYTIIGVAGPGFAFPRGSEMPGDFQFAATSDVWVPLLPATRGPSDLAIVGRLRPGATFAAARNDMDRTIDIVDRTLAVPKGQIQQSLVPLRTQVVGHVELMLVSLLAGVVLVLIIACVNTAQLLLAQLQVRRREMAVRAALGASTRMLAVEVFAEVLVLTLIGGAAGVALGVAGQRFASGVWR